MVLFLRKLLADIHLYKKSVIFYFVESQLIGDQSPITEFELHWSSYKSATNSPYGGNSPKIHHGQRPSTSSLPADTHLNAISPQSPITPPLSTPSSPIPVQQSPAESRRRYTPPPTPPLVKPYGKVSNIFKF